MSENINARSYVRHTGCTLAANEVTIKFTCTSLPSARSLFTSLSNAIRTGDVSLALPAVPAERGQP